jgi:hypothetical protein
VKYVSTKLSVPLARQLLKVRKHSPVIMFGAGVVGAVASTVLACKATLKVEEIIAEAEKDRAKIDASVVEFSDKYSPSDADNDLKYLRIRTTGKIVKLYAPAVGVGLISVSLLTGAHVVLTRRNASLTAAYIAVDRAFKEYRERVVGELGAEKDREFRYGVQTKEIVEEGEHGHEVKTIKRNAVHGKSMYAAYYDEGNKHWSNYPADNKAFLMAQQAYANNRLHANGFLMYTVGWVKGYGDDYVDFGFGDMSDPVVYDFFVNLTNTGILLDFNVDGPVQHLIDEVNKRNKR